MSRTTGARPRPRRASSRWPVPLLLDTLRRQGWGALDGRPWKGLRAVLGALASRLGYATGEGTATVEQIATAAGYGLRWTRQALAELEAIGLVEWRRGGVQYGRPVPSWFRISKTMLADLVDAAREQRTAAMVELAAQTRQRLARLHTIRMVRGRRKPAAEAAVASLEKRRPPFRQSAHVAVDADPSSRGGTRRAPAPRPGSSGTPSTVRAEARTPLPEGLSGPDLARAVLAGLGRSRT